MKLKDSTSIPLTWVAAAYIPTTSLVIAVMWWVFTVDSRLERIEHSLGIDSPVATSIIPEAHANELKAHSK